FRRLSSVCFFFFNDTATLEIFTLSLHDALPIMFSVLVIRLRSLRLLRVSGIVMRLRMFLLLITFLKASHSFRNRLLVISRRNIRRDRKSGSAGMPRPISYAVFCLKKKNTRRRPNDARL